MQTSPTNTMKMFDRFDIAILSFMIAALILCILMIAYGVGATNEMNRYRKDAIERNFAYYVVDSSGKAEFHWKTPVRYQDSVNESLVRISL
jgi:hypothetical protein